MISLIWNNKWILNFNFTKNTIKKFLSDYCNKIEVCKCYYLFLFSLESIEKIKTSVNNQNSKEITLLDWELDNCNYIDYSKHVDLEEQPGIVLDFIFQ